MPQQQTAGAPLGAAQGAHKPLLFHGPLCFKRLALFFDFTFFHLSIVSKKPMKEKLIETLPK